MKTHQRIPYPDDSLWFRRSCEWDCWVALIFFLFQYFLSERSHLNFGSLLFSYYYLPNLILLSNNFYLCERPQWRRGKIVAPCSGWVGGTLGPGALLVAIVTLFWLENCATLPALWTTDLHEILAVLYRNLILSGYISGRWNNSIQFTMKIRLRPQLIILH